MLRKYHAKLQEVFFSRTARTARSKNVLKSYLVQVDLSMKPLVKALYSILRLDCRSTSILISALESDPDVYLLYLSPEGVMKMVQTIQRIDEEELTANLSGIASVCFNCTIRPYVTNQLCTSFGCIASRKYGGVESDELIVGVLSEKAGSL
ncbi:MAG: DUF169 domain-containing protein [Candidatus Bathyarchaeia archaeon]